VHAALGLGRAAPERDGQEPARPEQGLELAEYAGAVIARHVLPHPAQQYEVGGDAEPQEPLQQGKSIIQ
jgi:hypothetical protein